MQLHTLRTTLVLLAILLGGCASGPAASAAAPAQPATGVATAPKATARPTQTADPASCDLTGSLSVSSWLGNHKVNDVGTKECDYIVTLRNMHRTESIVPLIFQRNMEAFKGSDASQWQALPPIAPGGRYEFQGFVYLINDARASIPMAGIPLRVVALRLDDACTVFQSDTAYLQSRGLAMKQPCASDLLLWPDFLPATIPGPND
jgi:hypothetical protein